MKYSFYITQEQINDNKVFFSEKQKNRIKNVLRLKKNELVRVCDGEGNVYKVNSQTGEILEKLFFEKNKEVFIRGLITISKKSYFETSIEKCVEMGIDEIVPIITQRSVIKVNDVKKKINRYFDIMISAFCQCKMNYLPKLKEIIKNIEEIPDYNGEKVVLYEEENDTLFKKFLEKNRISKEITFLIGPEGGLEKSEVEILKKKGFISCKLTKNVLRCDTAVIFTLANINFFYEL